ncbi:MAG: hypothetical protein JKY34_05155 [Kordiimonadaceae bacterium]|nr:hypothetical protein [Kordiimonadaceae bacterium]
MNHPINSDGLARLIRLELSRTLPASKAEARRVIHGRMGVYDTSGTTINAGIDSYFADMKLLADKALN